MAVTPGTQVHAPSYGPARAPLTTEELCTAVLLAQPFLSPAPVATPAQEREWRERVGWRTG